MTEKNIKNAPKSYRFSKATLDQIDILFEKDKRKALMFGYKNKSKTEIIEEAISKLYLEEINPSEDKKIYNEISNLIDDKLRLALSGFDKSLNHIMYEQLKSNEYWNILMQTAFNKSVPDDKVNELVHTENKWNFEIELKLADTFKRK